MRLLIDCKSYSNIFLVRPRGFLRVATSRVCIIALLATVHSWSGCVCYEESLLSRAFNDTVFEALLLGTKKIFSVSCIYKQTYTTWKKTMQKIAPTKKKKKKKLWDFQGPPVFAYKMEVLWKLTSFLKSSNMQQPPYSSHTFVITKLSSLSLSLFFPWPSSSLLLSPFTLWWNVCCEIEHVFFFRFIYTHDFIHFAPTFI